MQKAVITMVATVGTAAPLFAQAAEPVQLASDVFIERFEAAPGGGRIRVLERADQLRAGDRVIFVVNWKASRTREFTVTNPMPRSISFQSSARDDQEVSVDGGHTWGALPDLIVHLGDGQWRHARAEDVTHVRWRVPGELAALGAGQMTYRGVVR